MYSGGVGNSSMMMTFRQRQSEMYMQQNQGTSENSSNSGLNSFDNENAKKYIKLNIAKNKKMFDLQLKNLKPIVYAEAVDFVKNQSKRISKLLTDSHR